jgi:hypothetical protein
VIMKTSFICLLMIAFFISCNNNHDLSTNVKELKSLHWNNKYEVFDEPSSQSIAEMKFYLLMISGDFMDTLTILSIRQASNSLQGFYKKVPYDQVPALFPNSIETKSFKYSSIRFALNISQVDSIKEIIRRNDLFSLKDTVKTNVTDGTTREIIVYNGEKFYDLYRGYVFGKDVESQFINSFKEIMKFAPPEPIP